MWDLIAVSVIVAAAVFLVVRNLRRTAKGDKGCGCGCSCAAAENGPQPLEDVFRRKGGA